MVSMLCSSSTLSVLVLGTSVALAGCIELPSFDRDAVDGFAATPMAGGAGIQAGEDEGQANASSVASVDAIGTDVLDAPPAPEGLHVEEFVAGGAIIAWSSVPGATHYQVYRRDGDEAELWMVASETQPRHEAIELETQVSYGFVVHALGLGGMGEASQELAVELEPALTNLTLTSMGLDEVEMAWPALEGAVFEVQYFVGAEDAVPAWESAGTTGATAMVVSGMHATVGYGFRVMADREGEISQWGDSIYVPRVPATPDGVVVAAVASDGAQLAWAASEAAHSYHVAIGETPDGAFTETRCPTHPGLTYTGLPDGSTYYLRVAASSVRGRSGWSDPVAVSTPVDWEPPSALPGTPASPTASTDGAGNLVLSWLAGPGQTDEHGYSVWMTEAGGSMVPVTATTDSRATLGCLDPGSEYEFSVRSTWSSYESALAQSVAVILEELLP